MTLSLEKHYRQQLEALILEHRMIMSILKALHSVEPNAYIAAGIIRNTVWAHLHGVEYDLNASDVGFVAFWAFCHLCIILIQHRRNQCKNAKKRKIA